MAGRKEPKHKSLVRNQHERRHEQTDRARQLRMYDQPTFLHARAVSRTQVSQALYRRASSRLGVQACLDVMRVSVLLREVPASEKSQLQQQLHVCPRLASQCGRRFSVGVNAMWDERAIGTQQPGGWQNNSSAPWLWNADQNSDQLTLFPLHEKTNARFARWMQFVYLHLFEDEGAVRSFVWQVVSHAV